MAIMLVGMTTLQRLQAQTTITTVGANYTGTNSSGSNLAITFVVENTNSFPMLLTGVSTWVTNTDGVGTYQLWQSGTSLSGTPLPISSPTWTMIGSATGVAAPTTSGITPVISGMNFVMQANTQYRFAMWYVTTSNHYSGTGVGTVTPSTFTSNGVVLKVGDVAIPTGSGNYVGWSSVNNPRWFTGAITFQPYGPCTDPPVAGTPTATATNICQGQSSILGIVGGTGGAGQTYQWEYATSLSGPWTDIGPSQAFSTLTVSPTVPTYYRCKETCGTGTSTTTEIQIFVPTPFPGGNYTINNNLPTAGSNFNSFTAAVSAISCGIAGPVVFDVDPSSGPYTEQITLPATIGSNAVNTVTFNGNGRTLQFNSTNTAARSIITLNGADYITINDLVIDGSAAAATYAWGILFTGGADYNTVSLCNIKTSITNTTSGNHYPIVFSNSQSAVGTAGNTGSYNTFQDNTFSGGYYGVYTYGTGVGSEQIGNTFNNCVVKDYYLYGIFNVYQKNLSIIGCDFSKPNRILPSTSAGIYISTCGAGIDIENNRIHDMFAAVTAANTNTLYGIYCTATATVAEPTKIINNVIYNINNNLFTGSSYGIYNSSSSNMQCYHNTIAFDNTTATAGTAYGIYQTGTATGVSFQNNMITLRRGGTGNKIGLYYSTTSSAITSNGNNVYVSSTGTGLQLYGQFGTVTYASLPLWQTANSGAYDANSKNINPAYVNAAAGDLTPTSLGTNNIGSVINVPYDINGTPRLLSAPDPGAYEYSLPGLDASISWVSPTSPATAGLKTIIVNCVNNLSTPITSITLTYTDGVTPITETFSGLSFAPSTAQSFSFTTQYNLVVNGTLKAFINNVNGISDNNQLNDTTATISMCLQLNGAYTINPALPAGSGNFQTFASLAAALSCGGISGPVTVNVTPGTYTEQVAFNVIPGSSSVNTVTINGNSATIQFNATGDYHTVRLNGADYMTWNNMNFNGTNGTNSIPCLLSNASDYNNFNNCNFTVPQAITSSTSSALAFSSSTTSPTSTGNNGNYNTFTGCTMSGGYYCVSVYGNLTAAPVLGNQFINCHITEYYIYGLYNVYGNSTIVKGCLVDRPTRSTISSGYGIAISTGSGCLVQDNKVRKLFGGAPTGTNFAYGLYCASAATAGNENKFINNVVSDLQSNTGMYGMYLSGASYCQAYHNTILLNDAASTSTSTCYGIYATGTAGMDIRNNIVTVTRGGTATKYALYFTTPAGVVSNYNDLYVNAPAGVNYVAYNGTTSYATLGAYQSGNPTKDQQSVAINPNFNNPLLFDYKPTEVTLNDLGINAGVLFDITGAARAATPDMGAYEFSVAPTDIGMYTFDSPNSLGCYSSTQSITVSVKNYGSSTIDFSVNPVTVSADVSGPIPTTTVSSTVSTGTLAAGATMSVTLAPTYDMTANGTYTFSNIFTSMPGDGNTPNNLLSVAVTRTVGVIAGTISSNYPAICVSATPTLTLAGSYGGAIQWQESTVGASGPWTNVGTGATTYTPSSPVTQTSWYQAVITCNTNTATTNMLNLIVTNPVITGTTPGSRCGVGTVSLGATSPAGTSQKWFANATGGISLGTGSPFTTPSIASTTTFYVEAVTGAGTLPNLGCTTIPPSSGFNAKRGIQFDAYQAFTLNSFDFYAAYAGTTNLTVELQNSAGTVLQTATINEVSASATAGWHTVPLNFLIPAGTGLKLLCVFNTGSTSNYSHSSGADYTLPAFNYLGGVGLITNGLEFGPVVSTTTYYYFYNLNVTAGCSSAPRTPVVATVVAPPAITVTNSNPTICVGQSSTLVVTSPNDPNYTYTWSSGATTASTSVSPTSTTSYTLNAIDNTTGTYATCAAVATTSVTVNPVPTPITVTPASASVCDGNIQSLAATGGTIGGLYTIGTGTTSTSTMGSTPYGSFYEGQHVQYLMTAAELNALGMVAGSISSMAFNVITPGPGTFAQSGFTIKMAHTASTALSGAYGTPTGSFTTVLGPITQGAPTTGWNTHTFTTPFSWDGTSNILIDICHDNDIANTCASCYSTSSTVSAHTTTFASNFGTYNDNAQACSVIASLSISTYTTRPDIRFNSATPTNLTWSPVTDLYTNAGATTAYTGTPSAATVYTKPTASQLYTVTATTTNGCTATATSNITWKPTSSSSTTANACITPYTWNGNNYTTAGTYTYTTTNSVGCDSVATLNLTFNPCNSMLNLTMMIQGYFDGVSGMLPVLANQFEPTTAGACDSIDVELRDEFTYAVAASVRTVLQTNGTASCTFPALSGNYYIAVKHRNAIQTWSANPVAIGSTPATYNFTTAASQAYGDNQIEVATGLWAFYSGDVVVDENMDLLDINLVEADISGFGSGYLATDINGDGNVDLLDSPSVEANISSFIFSNHP